MVEKGKNTTSSTLSSSKITTPPPPATPTSPTSLGLTRSSSRRKTPSKKRASQASSPSPEPEYWVEACNNHRVLKRTQLEVLLYGSVIRESSRGRRLRRPASASQQSRRISLLFKLPPPRYFPKSRASFQRGSKSETTARRGRGAGRKPPHLQHPSLNHPTSSHLRWTPSKKHKRPAETLTGNSSPQLDPVADALSTPTPVHAPFASVPSL